MNHLWFDDFNNLWRTPVDWGTRPPPRRFPVLAITPDTGRYARYVGRESTHIIELEEQMSPEDVELFRREPEAFLFEAQGDAA